MYKDGIRLQLVLEKTPDKIQQKLQLIKFEISGHVEMLLSKEVKLAGKIFLI